MALIQETYVQKDPSSSSSCTGQSVEHDDKIKNNNFLSAISNYHGDDDDPMPNLNDHDHDGHQNDHHDEDEDDADIEKSRPTSTSQMFRRPKLAITTIMIVQFLLYLDRGILPGAHSEFQRFIGLSENGEMLFGALQGSFICGLSICAPIISYWSTKIGTPIRFICAGLICYEISGILAMMARIFMNVPTLFVSRAISGAGEAAFVSIAPPLLLLIVPPANQGKALAAFYGLMPLGTAGGCVFSSMIVETFGWSWGATFAIQVFAMLVPLTTLIWIDQDTNNNVESKTGGCRDISIIDRIYETTEATGASANPTFLQATARIAKFPVFLFLLLACAAQAMVVASLGAFGTAFMLNLQFFKSELMSSATIGVGASLAGVLGAAGGGKLLSVFMKRTKAENDAFAPATEIRSQKKLLWLEQETESDYCYRIHGLRRIIKFTIPFSLAAGILSTMTPLFSRWTALFLVFLFLALSLNFLSQTATNFAVMLTTPAKQRALAISFLTLGFHILGDVPGPLITGHIKDVLAPHCATKEITEECISERNGLITTLFIILSVMNVVSIAMGAAWVCASRELSFFFALPAGTMILDNDKRTRDASEDDDHEAPAYQIDS